VNTKDWFEAQVADPQDVEGAYAFCLRLAESNYENFPVASRLIARPLRRHVAALYAFARIADDFSDEPEYGGVRVERLNEWREQLRAVGGSPARHPVFLALERTFAELKLPREPFDDLLSAFLQDCEKKRYESWEEVLDYCRRSADPVGRIVLMIHGYRDPELFRLSDRICSALRVTSFLQDVAVDLKKDRIYIPQRDFLESGYSEADMRMGVVNERFRNLMKQQWKRARAMFEEGEGLPAKLAWPLSWEIRLTWLGGNDILRKIGKLGFDTLHQRPALTRWDWPRIMWGMLTRS
jgi:squalene synthase HpnC